MPNAPRKRWTSEEAVRLITLLAERPRKSYTELAALFGCSQSGINSMIQKLRRAGHVIPKVKKGRPKGLQGARAEAAYDDEQVVAYEPPPVRIPPGDPLLSALRSAHGAR